MLFSQPNPQSKKITKKFFSDPNIEINTPAFSKKKGFTKYDEMMTFLNKYVSENEDLVSLTFVGESQKGKKIPLLVFNKNNDEEKIKVWFQAGLHGNEPASTEGILYLINQLLIDDDYKYLFERITLAIIPMANIDGYEKNDRYAANGLDLNRDHTKLVAKESICLKSAFSDFGAEVSVDFHEYTPFRKDFAKLGSYGISNIYDVMFLYSGNLNVPQNLRNYTNNKFVNEARKVLDLNDLKHHDYISTRKYKGSIHFNQGSNSARSSCTSFALTNSISSLIEVRGVGIGKTSFKRRVNSTFIVALSYLQTAFNNTSQIKETINKANDDKSVAVTESLSKVYEKNIQIIDLDKSEEVTFKAVVHDKFDASIVSFRNRPLAYLINKSQYKVIEKLKFLGIEMDSVQVSQQVKVERYIVKDYIKQSLKYEGVYMQKVKAQTEVISHFIDNNWLVVNMNQRKSNLAIEVLEPEAPNSFVSYSIIPTSKGAELPVYRLNTKL